MHIFTVKHACTGVRGREPKSGQFQGPGIVLPRDSLKRCDIHLVPVNTVTDKPVKRKIIIDIGQQHDLFGIVRGLVKLSASCFQITLSVGKTFREVPSDLGDGSTDRSYDCRIMRFINSMSCFLSETSSVIIGLSFLSYSS